MIKTTIPEIDVEQLMARVRATAAETTIPRRPETGLPSPPPFTSSITPPPQFSRPKAVDAKAERLSQMLQDARQKNDAPSWIPKPLRRFFRKQGGYNRILLDALAVLTKTNSDLARHVEQLSAGFAAQQMWLRLLYQHVSERARELERVDDRTTSDASYVKAQLAQHSALLLRREGNSAEAEPQKESSPPGRLDAFYASFEDRFRGARSRISERVAEYLPYLAEAAAGTPERPVLDIGCGRGEWLELLAERKLQASGLDLNGAMVARCRERGLIATHGDAISYLGKLGDNTLGAVTAFHVIEHLPLETLLDLLTAAWRVLAPGGVVLFESPNCKNLLVGACHFYIDPTHRNPVYPETAEFMLNLCGFEQIKLLYPGRGEGSPFRRDTAESAFLDDRFFGAEDYAVIGRKPTAG